MPDPQNPQTEMRYTAIRKRLVKELAEQLPDDWVANANATDREDFRVKMFESVTIMAIVDTCAWTLLKIEEEEAERAKSS